MPSSAYDDAVRLLSFALSDALEMALKSAAGPHTETETLGVVRRLTNNVMEAFDRGEREHSALKRAVLREILVSPANPWVWNVRRTRTPQHGLPTCIERGPH